MSDHLIIGKKSVRWLDSIDLAEEYNFDPGCASVLGDFRSAQMVLDFVKRYPELHIISYFGNRHYKNRYVPNAVKYYVSDDDDDPELEWTVRPMTREEFEEILVEIRGDGSNLRRVRAAAAAERLMFPTPQKKDDTF